MSGQIITCRVPEEWLPQIDALASTLGVTRSEWLRGLIAAALDGGPQGAIALGGVDEGYKQARAFASQLATSMLALAADMMPETYEEAVARYGVKGYRGIRQHDDS